MTQFNERGAHTLVCVQSNRSIPKDAQECVCGTQLPKTFRPTYEIDGPHTRREVRRYLFWLAASVLSLALFVACVAFTLGAIARRFFGV